MYRLLSADNCALAVRKNVISASETTAPPWVIAANCFINPRRVAKAVGSAFRPSFPVAEGIGIFIAVTAWDVLSAGETSLIKAALIAIGGALSLFVFRCLQTRLRNKQRVDRVQ